MKKNLKASVFLLLILLFLSGCNSGTKYEDGVYFAQQADFPKSGWKYNVTLTVEKGKISSAVWNGSNINAGPDKVSLSTAGKYPMVANGGAQAEWHVQAKAVEDFFVENSSLEMPDTISGATIHYNEFYDLVKEAISRGPVGYGPFKDGEYSASDKDFHNGWKYYVNLTITSGYIVATHWDAAAEDGGTDKVQRSMDGEYGMVANSGAMAEWHEQALAVEKEMILTQSLSVPDAITGASISYDGFYSLVESALAGAKR